MQRRRRPGLPLPDRSRAGAELRLVKRIENRDWRLGIGGSNQSSISNLQPQSAICNLQSAITLSPPPQNDHRPIVGAPPGRIYYTWTLHSFNLPRRTYTMRLLLDQ